MTERSKPIDEPPSLVEIRDLPRRYKSPGGWLDARAVRVDVGLADEEAFKAFLLALYRSDAAFAHHVDARLVRALIALRTDRPLPPAQVPPEEESAWFAAEMACERCPGSQIEVVLQGMPPLPLCQLTERVERWTYCPKFRENAFAAAQQNLVDHDLSLALARADGMLEEFERDAAEAIVQVEAASTSASAPAASSDIETQADQRPERIGAPEA